MQKAHDASKNDFWRNKPDTSSPITQTELNRMEVSIDTIDDRVIVFDTSKANQSDLLTCVSSITYNTSTGIMTITLKNGTSTTIDTGLAKLSINFDYDDDPTSAHYQQLVIEMADGTYKYVDMTALITQYEFTNTSTIAWTVGNDGTITANVVDGSITEAKLQPNYLADIRLVEAQAAADALKSEGYADGKQDGTDVGSTSPYYHNNSKYYSEQAAASAAQVASDLASLQYREISVATTDWEANYNPDNSTDYPFLCKKIAQETLPVNPPEWRTASPTNPVPTGNEIKSISFVLEAWFGTGDKYYSSDGVTYTATTDHTIMIYATAIPLTALKFMYKGV